MHRYKGHATRRNIAEKHGRAALAAGQDDPWTAMFEAPSAEPDDSGGLSPFWLYDG